MARRGEDPLIVTPESLSSAALTEVEAHQPEQRESRYSFCEQDIGSEAPFVEVFGGSARESNPPGVEAPDR